MDLSKPVPGEVVDGLAEDFTDVQFTTSQTKVELQWRNYFDPESNISHYDVKVYRAKFALFVLWLFFLSYFDSGRKHLSFGFSFWVGQGTLSIMPMIPIEENYIFNVLIINTRKCQLEQKL